MFSPRDVATTRAGEVVSEVSAATNVSLNSTVVVLYGATIVPIHDPELSLCPSLVRRPPFRIALRRCDCYPC